MKKLLSAALLLLSLSLAYGLDNEVFAPFVSRLTATASDGRIALSWVPSSDLKGKFLIYGSSQEITSATFSKAKLLAELPATVSTWVDKPSSLGPFFYLVLLKDDQGKIYELFIAYRNKTTSAVSLESLSPETELAASVTSLKAEVKNTSIVLSFTASRDDRDLLIYRHNRPIENVSDLTKAQLIKVIPSTAGGFTDNPIPGILYYYGMIDANLVKIGQVSFVRGESSLMEPVEVPLSEEAINSAALRLTRYQPLPLLQLSEKVDATGKLVQNDIWNIKKADLVVETLEQWKALQDNFLSLPTPDEIKYTILEPETLSGRIGDEYTLAQIVNTSFASGSWDKAKTELESFLNSKHSQNVTSRTYFYIGQACYFSGEYREAFLTFLLAYDDYFLSTKDWLTACYSKLSS